LLVTGAVSAAMDGDPWWRGQNRAIIDALIAEPYTSMKLDSVGFLAWAKAANENECNEMRRAA
jgi:hypothetical protein